MNITIPIYVEYHGDVYTVRPLFVPGPVQRDEKLERVLHLLARELRKELRELGKDLRHEGLAEHTFCPDLEYHRLDLEIELRKRRARGRPSERPVKQSRTGGPSQVQQIIRL